MKKSNFKIAILLACALIAVAAIAGSVYDRATVTLGTKTGAATWTNTAIYGAAKLVRISIQNVAVTSDIVTINRVTVDNGWTQLVGTVTCGNYTTGTTNIFSAASYLGIGDKLVFSSALATGSLAQIEFEFQKH